MKIRIAVVTAEHGETRAAGCVVWYGDETAWDLAEEQAMTAMGWFDFGNPPPFRRSIVDAPVPLPEPPAEVAGEVEGRCRTKAR